MEIDLNALQELPAEQEQASIACMASCARSCSGTCTATCTNTGA